MQYFKSGHHTNILILNDYELPDDIFDIERLKSTLATFTIKGKCEMNNKSYVFEFPVDIQKHIIRNACERLDCKLDQI